MARLFAPEIVHASVLLGLATPGFAQCGTWETPFGSGNAVSASATGIPQCITAWDPDGAGPMGPRFVVGGQFTIAGGATVSKIGLWDGTTWRAMGEGLRHESFPVANGVEVVMSWDMDGPGPMPPQLMAGGGFTHSGNEPINSIARWDGTRWHALGTGFAPGGGTGQPHVACMIVFDPDGDGPQAESLIAGGSFVLAGETVVNNIARWDGTQWRPMGSGLAELFGTVMALTTWDPDGDGPLVPILVAGGKFNTAGGDPTLPNVARWDGSQWLPMGAGLGERVDALTSWDPDGSGPELPRLVATGDFKSSGGTPTAYIAQWDGSAWQPIGGGLSDRGYALTSYDSDGAGPLPADLVVTGRFKTAGTVTVNSIARWDGAQWHAFDAGTPLSSDPGSVLGVASANISSDPSAPATLLIAGWFATHGPGGANAAGYWDGTMWRGFGSGLDSQVNSVVEWIDDGSGSARRFVAGGTFKSFGTDNQPLTGVAAWDGSRWEQMGSGLGTSTTGGVSALLYWDAAGNGGAQLHACGSFTNSGGTTINRIARWDGHDWRALGTGLNATAVSMCSWDPDGAGPLGSLLVVGGDFTSAGGNAAARIAAWNGSTWTPLGAGFDKTVSAITSWDPDGDGPLTPLLIAGGLFTRSGSTATTCLAWWNGTSWQPFAAVPAGPVLSLLAWDPDEAGPSNDLLVVGGLFKSAGSSSTKAIATWNGSVWRPLGAGFTMDSNSNPLHLTPQVATLAVLDTDADGPLGRQLIAGGLFTRTGATPMNGIARWDGAAWNAMGGGVTHGTVLSVCTARAIGSSADLIIAGIDGIEDRSAGSLAVWRTSPPEFTIQPADLTLGMRCTGALTVDIAGTANIAWQTQNAQDAWITVSDGMLVDEQNTALLEIAGSGGESILIKSTHAFAQQSAYRTWRCIAISPCGEETTSGAAALSTCPADFDCTGFSDTDDFTAFVLAFELSGDDADFDGSGYVDTDDFTAFVLAFEAGC